MAQQIFEAVSKYGLIVSLVLQAVLLSRFFDSRNRNYPLAILFSVVLFLLTSAATFYENFAEFIPKSATLTSRQVFILGYSAGDLFMHVLLLALMLQLIRKTLKSLELETRVIYILAAVSVLVAVSAYVWYGADLSAKTFLKTRQVVSFWMVLLNLYWWTLLLRRRQLDRRILLLSAGVGLMMTGQVIGDGINGLANGVRWISVTAALIMYGTHFACLFAWYNAFRPELGLPPRTARSENLDPSLT